MNEIKRKQIEQIWRKLFKPAENAQLAVSEVEWAFFSALLDHREPLITPELRKEIIDRERNEDGPDSERCAKRVLNFLERKEHPTYITTTSGMSGYFAVCMVWYTDMNGYDVWQTGVGRYKTENMAIAEAQEWARADGIEYRD